MRICSVQADSDGDTLDFPAMISQLFELLITLAGSNRIQPVLSQYVPWLVDLSLGAPCTPPGLCPLLPGVAHGCSVLGSLQASRQKAAVLAWLRSLSIGLTPASIEPVRHMKYW